jgi:hypothetical protein
MANNNDGTQVLGVTERERLFDDAKHINPEWQGKISKPDGKLVGDDHCFADKRRHYRRKT